MRSEQRGREGFLVPVEYSRRTAYRRPPVAYLRMQWIGPLLARWAVVPGYVAVLEVHGRRSGALRRVTVVRVSVGGAGYVVALAGESQWVRNVRAAGGRVLIGTRRRRPATLVEVPVEERAPVIRAYIWRAGRRPGARAAVREARSYFGIAADASLEEIAGIAPYYPVFRIVEDGGSAAASGGPGSL